LFKELSPLQKEDNSFFFPHFEFIKREFFTGIVDKWKGCGKVVDKVVDKRVAVG
jgi:hypothetical protein